MLPIPFVWLEWMVWAWSDGIEDLNVDIDEIIQDLKVALYPQWGIIEGLKVT